MNCCVATVLVYVFCFQVLSLGSSIFVYFVGDTTCFTHFELVILRVFYIRNYFIFSKAKETSIKWEICAMPKT